MEVSKEKLMELLELQQVDSTIDRLEARKRALPEQAQLEELEEELADLERDAADQQAVVDEIAIRQGKLDGDIEAIRAKTENDEKKLYSGEISNPKELTDLQKEIESLTRRQGTLEDQDLEVMEEKEKAEKVLNPMLETQNALKEKIAEAIVVRDRAAGDVVVQLEEARAERERWAPKFPDELLELYDDLRSSKGGVGAAALIDGTCQGCHMKLPNQEFERLRNTTGMVFCSECRRILVVQ